MFFQTLTILLQIADSKSSSGTTPLPSTLWDEKLFSHLRLIFSDFFHFGVATKIIKNRTSIKSTQNLKNRIPGCQKLDFGTILNDFWHHFFDKFPWPPKSRNLQQLSCENIFLSFQASFEHQKSIKTSCFFKAASWTSFFYFCQNKMVDFRIPFKIDWESKWQPTFRFFNINQHNS